MCLSVLSVCLVIKTVVRTILSSLVFLLFLVLSVSDRVLTSSLEADVRLENFASLVATVAVVSYRVLILVLAVDASALRINLNIDGTPIVSRSHTHPSHTQTSLL